MGPIKKKVVDLKRRTLNVVPPISTIRKEKEDIFDQLFFTNAGPSTANIFQSSSESEHSARFTTANSSLSPPPVPDEKCKSRKFFLDPVGDTNPHQQHLTSSAKFRTIFSEDSLELDWKSLKKKKKKKKKLDTGRLKKRTVVEHEYDRWIKKALSQFSPSPKPCSPRPIFASTPLLQVPRFDPGKLLGSGLTSPIHRPRRNSRAVVDLGEKFNSLSLKCPSFKVTKCPSFESLNKSVPKVMDVKSIVSETDQESLKSKETCVSPQKIVLSHDSEFSLFLEDTPNLPQMHEKSLKNIEKNSFEVSESELSLKSPSDQVAEEECLKKRKDTQESEVSPQKKIVLSPADSEYSLFTVEDTPNLSKMHENSLKKIVTEREDSFEVSESELSLKSPSDQVAECLKKREEAQGEVSPHKIVLSADSEYSLFLEDTPNLSKLHDKSLKKTERENSFEVSESSESYESLQDSESSYEPSPSEKNRSFMDELAEERLSVLSCSMFDDDLDHSPTRVQTRSLRNLPLGLYDRASLDPLPENQEDLESEESDRAQSDNRSPVDSDSSHSSKTPPLRRPRMKKERPSRRGRPTLIPELNKVVEESENDSVNLEAQDEILPMEHFVLPAGKKYRRSLSIIKHLDAETTLNVPKGRKYESSVDEVIKLQTGGDKLGISTPTNIVKKKISLRRTSLLKQFTPPPRRRSRMSLHFPSTPCSSTSSRNTSFSVLKESLEKSGAPFVPSPFNSSRIALKQRLSNIEESPKESRYREAIITSFGTPPSQEEEEEDFSEIVFLLCQQSNPYEFKDILSPESYEGAVKVGEGVFGEVFFVARQNKKNVLKIIPIEGAFPVNGEKQKTYGEVYSELLITRMLNELRGNGNEYFAAGFVELISALVVRGRYPEELIRLWKQFDTLKGSDNDDPTVFGDNQLFLVLELAHAGTDLESYSFSTARQALSIFKQTAMSLAVAECVLEFEHRDLHWGNILISGTTERQMRYTIGEETFSIATNGVKATIIDFTLSRALHDVFPVFCDIGKDPEMFIATGDYQFDIYRHMRKDLNNEWGEFNPMTNVRWLHYLLDKMLKEVKYKRKSVKVHKDSIKELEMIESWILECSNSYEVAIRISS